MHWLFFLYTSAFIHRHHSCSSALVLSAASSSSPAQQGPFIMNHKLRPKIVTWLIDGNNLKCFRGVPDDRESMIQELQKIASDKKSNAQESNKISVGSNNEAGDKDGDGNDIDSSSIMICNVVLVFDGDQDETFSKHVSNRKWFQHVITDGEDKCKDRADNYMIDEVLPNELKPLQGKVHLVTADKELGKRASATRIMKGGSVVPPSEFWRQYLPNLQKQQQQQRNKD